MTSWANGVRSKARTAPRLALSCSIAMSGLDLLEVLGDIDDSEIEKLGEQICPSRQTTDEVADAIGLSPEDLLPPGEIERMKGWPGWGQTMAPAPPPPAPAQQPLIRSFGIHANPVV